VDNGGVVFGGNGEAGDQVVWNHFNVVVTARFVRIEPVDFEDHICMRAGVYIERGGPGECGANAACLDTSPALTCACDAGYTGDGLVCVPS